MLWPLSLGHLRIGKVLDRKTPIIGISGTAEPFAESFLNVVRSIECAINGPPES